MKTKTKSFLLLLAISICGSIGFAVSKHLPGSAPPAQGRNVAYYQDSMHPWIKSDRPGKCTVCAMELTPIYEGAQGFEASDKTIVLTSNSITVLNVQTDKVEAQALRRTLRVAGTLEASETSKRVISAGKAGRIERLAVPYAGFDVAEGERLANFFIPDLLAEARRYALLARTGARAGQTPEADLSNPLLATRQNLRLFGLTDAQIENIAITGKAEGSFELLSPVSGTVIERNVSDGQYVSEGTRLFTIVDLSVLWFRFDAYEQDLPWLHVGQVVEFSVPTAPGKTFSGPITFIEPFVGETTRTAKVRVDVANPIVEINGVKQRALRQQLYAEGRVQIELAARLVIPSTAVLFPGAQAYAYVDIGGGAYEIRQLKLGRRGDQHWEVLAGLDAGEDVVTAGNVLIDAQAQFNRGADREEATAAQLAAAANAEEHHAKAGHPVDHENPGLSRSQAKSVSEFLAAADGISRALAADRFDEVKPHLAMLPGLVAAVEQELGANHTWQPLLRRIRSAARWGVPTSLATAREAFLPFSTNLVEFVQQLRAREEGFRSLKVYQCPMAPKPGLWFQAQGPLRNPYFGAEMLSCGKELRPEATTPDRAPDALAKLSPPTVPPTTPATPQPARVMTSTTSAPPVRVAAVPRRPFMAERPPSSEQVQPLSSRDHSAFEERMKVALAAQFAARGASGTNATRRFTPPTPASARPPGTPQHPAPNAQH